MARPLRIVFAGAFYHITSRGNEKKDIFKGPSDRKKFLAYLESATERYGAIIHIYCLMDNHYHLLLETPAGNLSQIMRHINGAYTTYFNVKHDRSGHLFQGRYKAILVDIDAYAIQVSRYIHLNPVRAGRVDDLNKYPWSSYPYYIGQSRPPGWLRRELVLGYFGKDLPEAQRAYRQFVETGMDRAYANPLDEVVGSTILGRDDFVKRIKERYVEHREDNRDLPALRELSERPSMERIDRAVEAELARQPRLSRKLKIYLSHRYSGRKLKEIGQHYGLGESGVSQTSHRLAGQAREDASLMDKIRVIERRLGL